MRKKILMFGSIIIGIIALWIILKIFPFKEIINAFTEASIQVVIGYLIVCAAIMASLAWRWRIVLRSQGIKIPFRNLYVYRIIGYGVSYLTPTAKVGGEPVRAALLSKHKVRFRKALSSAVIDKTIEIASSSIFFFIGVLTILINFALPENTELMLLVFAVIFLTVVILFYQRMVSGKGIIKQAVKFFRIDRIKKLKIDEEKLEHFENLLIKFYRRDHTHFALAIGVSLLSWVLMFMEFKLAMLILGFNVSFTVIFLIVSFVGAAVLVPVPMAIGVLEASQVAIFRMVDLRSSAGVALAFLVRARDLLWSIIALLLLSYHGIKISTTLKKEYENITKDE